MIAILLLLWRLLVSIRINRLTAQSRREDNGYLETSTSNSSSEHGVIMVPQGKGNENKLTFSDIVKATCGGYGLVYKAELPDGCKLAIKKLNDEMCLMEREFTAEVEALSMAQHGWVATLRVVLLELLTGLRPVPVLTTSIELVLDLSVAMISLVLNWKLPSTSLKN
jgi:hypothetical protein